jgi:tetratricopeptide (TPR) repeat protein
LQKQGILPIKTNLVLFLATIAGRYSKKKISLLVTSNARTREFFSYSNRIIFSVTFPLLVYACSKSLYSYSKAYRSWKEASQVYKMGAYETCLKDYEKAMPVLNRNGDFLTGYGKALSMAGKHQNALKVLLQAAIYYPNIVVFTAMGDSYKQMQEKELAEQAYLKAWYMNPSRFYPKYLLAKLYEETGQREKAILTANQLLNMPIKVPSTAIDEIKQEMLNILENFK